MDTFRNSLGTEKPSHRGHFALPRSEPNKADVGIDCAESADRLGKKLQYKLFPIADVAEEHAIMPREEFLNFSWQWNRREFRIVTRCVRDRQDSVRRNSCGQQD